MVAIDQSIRSLATGHKLDGRIKTQALAIYEQEIKFVSAQQPYESVTQDLKKKYIKLGPQCDNAYADSCKPSDAATIPYNISMNHTSTDNSYYSSGFPSSSTSSREKRVDDGIPDPAVDLWDEGVMMEWAKDSPFLHSSLGHGLHNMGNTCFLNSVLQIMVHTPPLVNYLTHHHHPRNCKATRIQNICSMCLMREHVLKALGRPPNNGSFTPTVILERMRLIMKSYIRGRQEDAHEFLRYLIDAMCNSALAGHKKLDMFSKQTSVINKIFGGYYRNEITCMACNEKSTTYDPFLDLSVEVKPMGGKLEDALSQFTRAEILKSDNAYKCQKCKKTVSAKKMYTIHRPPNVLTIQLKRFNHTMGKINSTIKFPERLNLRNYMSDKHGPTLVYSLYGVIVHHGGSTHSGHYFAFTKNMQGDWHLLDDNRVCPVHQRHVLNQNAYLLFYIKVGTQIATVKPQTRIVPSNVVQSTNPSPATFMSLPSPNVHPVEPMQRTTKLLLPQRPTATNGKPTAATPSLPAPLQFSFKPTVLQKKNKFASLVKPKLNAPVEVVTKSSSESKCKKPLVPYEDDSPSNSDPPSPNSEIKTEGMDTNFSYNVFEHFKVKEKCKDIPNDPVVKQVSDVKDLYGNISPPETLKSEKDTPKCDESEIQSAKASAPPNNPAAIRLKLNLKQGKVENLTPPSFGEERKDASESGDEELMRKEKKRRKHKKKKKKHKREREEREGHGSKSHSPSEREEGSRSKKSSLEREEERKSRHGSMEREEGSRSKKSSLEREEGSRSKKSSLEREDGCKRGSSTYQGSPKRPKLGSRDNSETSSYGSFHEATAPSNDTVKRLRAGLSAGYGGAEVKSWTGGASVLSHHSHDEEREERRKRHLQENEFDEGKQKKVHSHGRHADNGRYGKHSGNQFQRRQNYANISESHRKFGSNHSDQRYSRVR